MRFLKQHRTTVGISALCFLLLIAAGIYSYGQIVEEKEVAEGAQRVAESRAEETKAALGVAEKERHAKEKAEFDKHEAAKAAYLEKAEVAPDLIRNLENRHITPFLEQLDGELLDLNQRYATRTDGGYMPLPVAEQKENKQLLDRLITYLSMKTRLLRLFSTPEGVEPTQVLQQIDKSALAAEVSTVRLKMAKLASFNANFELAGEILAGSVSKGLEVSNVSAEVSAYRTSALSFQASRISILMSSVDDGLNEVRGTDIWGPIPAQVDAIVDELKLYQNRKALASLKFEIAPLVAKLKSKQALTRVEIDKIVAVAKALSGFQFKTQAVAIVEEILAANSYPRIRDEMVSALTSNGSPVALEALIRIAHVRGRHFFEKYKDNFAEFPLPARLRNPSSAADYTDKALFLLATDKLDEATDSALRGVNMDQKGLIPLLVQAEIHVAKDEIGQALEAAKAAIALDASSYNAKLLYADVLNLQVSSKAIAAFDEAIKLDPTRETAYVQKARALVNRPTRWDAVPVLEEAVKNAHVPHRSLILLARLQSIWKIQRKNYDLGHALETCKKSLELDPGYFEAYAQICWQARRGVDGGFGSGINAGLHATTLNPEDTATYGQLAEIYFGSGRLFECEQAGLKNPESSLATYYAAIAITQKYGNHDYLIWQSRWLTGSASTHSMWRDRTRDLNRAVDLLRNSTKADPNDVRVKWMLTETLLALRKFREAKEVLVGLFKVAPASNTPYLPWAVTRFRKWHKGLSYLELLDVDLETDVTENIETQRKSMKKIHLLTV
ncbi:MAG: hypothetical protein L3J82_10570, partial [Planctomycetes bacterium]|nr:hypothetical protein [Planctomycetota bacterium]